MKLGFFTMPIHPLEKDWRQSLREDREAFILADELGFTEGYVGEHATDRAENITSCAVFIATLIDATDGTLARAVRIKEVLPGFDGRRLDDLIDFLTYVFLPLLLLWQEYRAEQPDGYGYSRFCDLYAAWRGRLSPPCDRAIRSGNDYSSIMPDRPWT